MENIPRIEVSEDDYRRSATPYDDNPLVVEIKVANLRENRVLIDTGSSSDIVSHQCLKKLQHDPSTIEDVHSPLVSFGGSIIRLVGAISLPIQIGEPPLVRQS